MVDHYILATYYLYLNTEMAFFMIALEISCRKSLYYSLPFSNANTEILR